jgi:Mn-containing catalase
LINVTDDPGVKDALGFLMTREIAHQLSFEKALYAIEPNFPPGKLPGKDGFANVYVNTSQGEGDTRGPWNSDENFKYISNIDEFVAMDGGDGHAQVELDSEDQACVQAFATRTASNTSSNPTTGAELGGR